MGNLAWIAILWTIKTYRKYKHPLIQNLKWLSIQLLMVTRAGTYWQHIGASKAKITAPIILKNYTTTLQSISHPHKLNDYLLRGCVMKRYTNWESHQVSQLLNVLSPDSETLIIFKTCITCCQSKRWAVKNSFCGPFIR